MKPTCQAATLESKLEWFAVDGPSLANPHFTPKGVLISLRRLSAINISLLAERKPKQASSLAES